MNWPTSQTPRAPESAAPVGNFGVVAPGCLYRGAQPFGRDWTWLAQAHGVRTILNLQAEHNDGDLPACLRKVRVPIRDRHSPSPEQMEQILAVVGDEANWPVFVHCKQGQGRTGTAVALIRVAFDKWDVGMALKEARLYRDWFARTFTGTLDGGQEAFVRAFARTIGPHQG